MPACHKGPFAVLPQALALCAFLAGSELALAQTAAHDSNASVTTKVGGPTSNAAASADQSRKVGANTASSQAVVDAHDPANKQTLLRNTTQSTKTGVAPSLPQAEHVTVHDPKGPNAAAGFSLASSDRCTVESELTVGDFDPAGGVGAIRPCHSHPYALQDARAPLAPSNIADEHRSGVVLPGAKNVHDDRFIDHLRLIDRGPTGGPKHYDLSWVERPSPLHPVEVDSDVTSPLSR